MATPAPSRLLEVVIHDLRNPLNVMGLTVRLMESEAAAGGPPPAEDLAMLRENIAEMDRMLKSLSEYIHLPAGAEALHPAPFDVRRMLEEEAEQVEEKRPGSRVDLDAGGPFELALDPDRARVAIRMVMGNVATAAGGRPIRVTVGREPGRCRIGFHAEAPPRDSIRPTRLQFDQFRRLLGSPHERRGLDLAIVARISELFGGSARLDVDEGRSTAVVLDWPTQLRPESV